MTTKRLDIVVHESGAVTATRRMDALALSGAKAAGGIVKYRDSLSQLRSFQGTFVSDGAKVTGQNEKTTRSFFTLRNAVLAAGAAFAVRSLARTADQYTMLSNRIQVVTGSSEELAAVQQKLFEQARALHQPIQNTSEIYQRFAVATDGLGLSHRDLLDFTEQLQKAISLSGRSAEETKGALVQLGQGMATNFQAAGQELRSLQEGAPELAKAIANAAGGSAGQLLQLAEQGKITRDVVVKAVRDMGKELDESWLKRFPPLSDGFQDLGTAITQMVGEVDRATGITRELGRAVTSLADDVTEAIPDIIALVKAMGTLSELGSVWTALFGEDDNFLTGISNLRFAALMVTQLTDRVVALARILSFKGVAFGGELSDLLPHLEMLATGVGPGTQSLLDSFAANDALRLGPGSQAKDPLDAKVGGAAAPDAPRDSGRAKGASFGSILGELQQEHRLLGLNNEEREIARDLLRAEQQMKRELTAGEREQLDTQLRLNALRVLANGEEERTNDLINERLKLELEAMELEKEQARLRGDEASRMAGLVAGRSEEMAAEGRLSLGGQIGSFGDDFAGRSRDMAAEQLEQFQTLGANMAEIFGPGGTLEQGITRVGGRMSDLVGHAIAFGAPWKDTEQAIRQVGQTILAEVISGIIQTTIQMGIQAATASSLRAQATAETVAQAATIAAAQAPAAAATSLATAGTNGIGATAAILGAAALAATTFAVGAALFREGGYTGDGGRGEAAGIVHGQEFVVNAEATRRNRDILEAMNNGGQLGRGGGLTVNVIDQAGGVSFETRQVDEGMVEVIARRIVQQEAPRVIAADIRNDHGKTARAISQSTSAARSRA